MDSRTLAFSNNIQAITTGYGVDVVLNALSGEFLRTSFELLAPYGRFIEIGKLDIDENRGLPMRAFNKNLSFTAIDLDRILLNRPEIAKQLFKEVIECFEKGYFHALPITAFPAAKAADAFRYMAQSKHIGKVALTIDNQPIEMNHTPSVRDILVENASYLITGGKSGLGLEVAKWLVNNGAKSLILASRNPATDAARDVIVKLRARGAHVFEANLDIADPSEMDRMIARITDEHPPLRGIFHGAMVLKDGLLTELQGEDFINVMAPKIQGALNLHNSTKELPIDFFISFSSVTSLIGNAGQANYAAANAFLDHFSAFRRAQGLPGTTINWGALAEAGVLAQNKDLAAILENGGIKGLTTQQIMAALDLILQEQPIQVGVMNMNWRQWASMNPSLARQPLLHTIMEGAEGSQDIDKKQEYLLELATMASKMRQQFLETTLQRELAKVLQLPPSKVGIRENITAMGVDSLMVVEVRSALQVEYGMEISIMDLMRGANIKEIATQWLASLKPELEPLEALLRLDEQELDRLLEEIEK
jgi:NAD(P)-dependent dehydrogenase (short-subunit alcohol dehydrogenase family)/acyl carrier protein